MSKPGVRLTHHHWLLPVDALTCGKEERSGEEEGDGHTHHNEDHSFKLLRVDWSVQQPEVGCSGDLTRSSQAAIPILVTLVVQANKMGQVKKALIFICLIAHIDKRHSSVPRIALFFSSYPCQYQNVNTRFIGQTEI